MRTKRSASVCKIKAKVKQDSVYVYLFLIPYSYKNQLYCIRYSGQKAHRASTALFEVHAPLFVVYIHISFAFGYCLCMLSISWMIILILIYLLMKSKSIVNTNGRRTSKISLPPKRSWFGLVVNHIFENITYHYITYHVCLSHV